MKNKATLKDVAKLSGVSTATVSYVINKSKSVSKEVEESVLDAMKALNYRPNTLAKSLRKQESKLIGLIISDISNSFFSYVVRGIEDELSKSGYNILLCNTDSNVEKERNYLDVLLGKRIDGLIVSAAGSTGEYFETLTNLGVPMVFLNRCPDFSYFDIVITDNIGGAYKATEHLIQHGYKKIGTITGPQDINTGRERLQGYIRALKNHGMRVNEDWIKEGQFDVESGYKLTKELMERTETIDALFIANNNMTLGCYKYLKEADIKVPQDVALIGFDDPDWATIVEPPLTAVDQPAYKQGVHAAELIVRNIQSNSHDTQQSITLSPSLIIRESCGCLPKNKGGEKL